MTRTKKQLENEKKLKDERKEKLEESKLEKTLLDRTAKRFKKTELNRIQPEKKDENTKEYFIEKYGFKFRLYLNENSKEGHLWVLDSKGYLFKSFDLSEEKYASAIKNMYEEIHQRIIYEKGKQIEREKREHKKNLRRLDRPLPF
jgi:hypothetical protein